MQNADELQGDSPALDADNPTLETELPEQEGGNEPESSTEQEQAEEHDEGAKPPRGVQKRLNELTANWREEQRRAQKLEQMLEQVLSQQRQPEMPKPQPSAPTQLVEPKLEQFQTYEDYVAALADYKADLKIQAWESKQRETEAERQREAEMREAARRMAEYRRSVPDYDAVAFNPQLPVSEAMAEILRSVDEGPQWLYLLGKHPEESARIAALPFKEAAVELGKFVAIASLPQPRTKTGAPPPVEPISGGIGTRSVDPDKMSTEEWLAWRQQQLKR